jgi:glycosyltransferase involved in cell wall biosynthesis
MSSADMPEHLPKISVVTPSFNQGRFIERTILSVLDQGYPALEYWVFDGGSADETVDILKKYAGRLRWTSEKDRGQADAVNKGLRASSGEIIGWLNSDDIYYPGAFATVAARFRADPEIDVIYGAGNHIDVDGHVIEPYPTEPWSVPRLSETCFICQPAVFFRRSVLERWGYLDETLDYCMDYEFWIRLARGGARFFCAPQILAGSRFYPETKTLGARVKVHAEINDMLRAKLGRTPITWILGYSHVVADDTFGIPRSRRRRHLAVVALTALYSSLRWNGAITYDLLKYLLTATAAALGFAKRA